MPIPSRTLRHRAPLFWLLLPLAAGIAIGQALPTPVWPGWLLGGAGLAGFAAILFASRPRAWASALALSFACSSVALYQFRRHRLPDWEELPPREAQLSLRIERLFGVSPDGHRINGLACIVQTDTLRRALVGQRIYFSLMTSPTVGSPPSRSAEISAQGVLAPVPRHPAGGSFDAYLADAGIGFAFTRGRVLALERAPGAYRQFCERAAARMSTWLGLGVNAKRPELTAIYRAMMLGQKHDLSPDQKEVFMHSGTMHLFAINGLHIGVVALSLHVLLALLRCPRGAAAALTLAVLWLDVDATGGSPSAVRAFLLVAGYEVAFVLRLPVNGLSAFSTAASIVLLLDPLALFSASFQMSYGVVLAILSLGLPLGEKLAQAWQPCRDLPQVTWTWRHRAMEHTWKYFAAALGIGISATAVSLITGVEFFHGVAPLALLANLALVPLASLVIVAGFLSIASGLVGATIVSGLFNHAAVLVLWAIDRLTRLEDGLPGAWRPAAWRTDGIGAIALSALLAACFWGYATGWSRRRGGWLLPAGVLAVAFIFGVKFG